MREPGSAESALFTNWSVRSGALPTSFTHSLRTSWRKSSSSSSSGSQFTQMDRRETCCGSSYSNL